jgi:hypothetical protein
MLAEAFTIGASHVQAFVGVGGPYRTDSNDDGKITAVVTTDAQGNTVQPDAIANPDAIGLVIDDFSFGLGLFQNKLTKAKYTALKANADMIGFVGFDDFIKFSLSDATVALNQGTKDGMVIDFTNNGSRAGLSVDTGGDAIVLDFNTSLIEASVGLATAEVAGIVSLQGGFAFQKKTISGVGFNLPGLEIVAPADALVVAGIDVQAFVGFDGPYRTLSKAADGSLVASAPNEDAIGFAIDNMDFIVSMLKPLTIRHTKSQMREGEVLLALPPCTFSSILVEPASWEARGQISSPCRLCRRMRAGISVGA